MSNMNVKMRVYHRYLGFFLAGIMAVYAFSGVVLIFRNTDFLKSEKITEKTFSPGIQIEELGKELKIRDFKIDREENNVLYFKNGTFDKATGIATITTTQLPYVIEKMTKLHKATNKDPLFFLNIFFGFSLLFFVVSSFWMFMPGSDIFRKGLYFTIGGIVLALIMFFV